MQNRGSQLLRDREQDGLTTRAVRFSDAIFLLGSSIGTTSQTAIDRSDEYTELFAIEEATDGGQERP